MMLDKLFVICFLIFTSPYALSGNSFLNVFVVFEVDKVYINNIGVNRVVNQRKLSQFNFGEVCFQLKSENEEIIFSTPIKDPRIIEGSFYGENEKENERIKVIKKSESMIVRAPYSSLAKNITLLIHPSGSKFNKKECGESKGVVVYSKELG